MEEDVKLVTFDNACRTICISATVWDNAKFYKRKAKGVGVVALRIVYCNQYRWTLAISLNDPDNRFYGIDNYFTKSAKLADVLKELDLI